ncbi:MAG: class I SAM-dependent methyltransferase [Candidatus Tectomicrobia bacterium]|nr:class I SAM-dependent methyltransferase [Candidatus Tectomicrobia bacterium]
MSLLKMDMYITDQDRERTCTVHMLQDLGLALAEVNGRLKEGNKLLDIGCGFGGLGMTIGNHLDIKEVYGIDFDARVLPEASAKGMQVRQWDISQVPLPYPSEHFDLVTSFGVFDYLPWFDDVLREVFRILKPGGYTIISLPNLASWHNRLVLLLGYQPRDIEVSKEILVGVHPRYHRDDRPTNHIHTVTTKAFKELMEHFGFRTICVQGGRPLNTQKPFWVDAIDWLLSKSAYLARRFFYIGQKPETCDISTAYKDYKRV